MTCSAFIDSGQAENELAKFATSSNCEESAEGTIGLEALTFQARAFDYQPAFMFVFAQSDVHVTTEYQELLSPDIFRCVLTE